MNNTIELNGVSFNRPKGTSIKRIFNNFQISHEDHIEFLFWEFDYIPSAPGVYVIYDIKGICLYVGCTPIRFKLKERIEEHFENAHFKNYGYKIHFYETKENTVDILLLERIFIKVLKPCFNNDANEKVMPAFAQEYIKNNYQTTHYSFWVNIDKTARQAQVPRVIVELKNEFEGKSGDLLEDIPQLPRGEIILTTFYQKLRKLNEEFNEINKVSYGIDDFIDIIRIVHRERGFSTEELTYLVLLNKSIPASLKKKFKKK